MIFRKLKLTITICLCICFLPNNHTDPTLSLGIIFKSDPCFKNIVPIMFSYWLNKFSYFNINKEDRIINTCCLLRIDTYPSICNDSTSSRVHFKFFSYKFNTGCKWCIFWNRNTKVILLLNFLLRSEWKFWIRSISYFECNLLLNLSFWFFRCFLSLICFSSL